MERKELCAMPDMIQTDKTPTTPGDAPDLEQFAKLLAALTPSERCQVDRLLDSLLKPAA